MARSLDSVLSRSPNRNSRDRPQIRAIALDSRDRTHSRGTALRSAATEVHARSAGAPRRMVAPPRLGCRNAGVGLTAGLFEIVPVTIGRAVRVGCAVGG